MREREFDALVRAHARAVSAYARALCRDRWMAEEAVQETFLRAWRFQDSFRGQGSYEGWLLRICRNCVVDLVQRQQVVAPLPVGHERSHPADDCSELYLALADLPLPQREVLVLCGILGYDYESAAELLELPVGTVRSRLHRGRAALTNLLRAAQEAG